MSRRFPSAPDDLREPHEVEWSGFMRIYVIAIGITILLGLVTGSIWIGWNLFRLHVLH
jgi:hypothetical protein